MFHQAHVTVYVCIGENILPDCEWGGEKKKIKIKLPACHFDHTR